MQIIISALGSYICITNSRKWLTKMLWFFQIGLDDCLHIEQEKGLISTGTF